MKGLETFVRAVPLVRSNVTSTRFLIIGDGPSLPGLKRLAAKLRLGDTLQFTGWVPFQDMSQYLAEATVGVPCRSGNLGNNFVVTTALLQYWAMEKPIVAPDLKAIRSTVQHGKNGLLFQPDNPSSLADGILRLLSDSEMAARVGRAGRETALRQFNVDTVSDCMLKALDIDCPSWSS
jgi:glycosyltransferase involved in cell wall biosynthesis